MAEMDFRGQEALCSERVELYGHSNHIHFFVRDKGAREVIPKSIHLIAERTGQEYNQEKKRKGALWKARHHATAVETGNHMIQCLVYMDMNMVPAGVVNHPSEWEFSGYNEIQAPRYRYALIDYEGLGNLLDFGGMDEL
jgi:putative transposase